MPTTSASDLHTPFEPLAAYWSPHLLATANGQDVKIANVKGGLVGHPHAEEDERFLVRKGGLMLRWRPDVLLADVVLRGAEPMTAAPEAGSMVLVEPAATKHTGDTEHELTTSIEQQLAHLRGPAQDTRQQETEAQWPSKS